MKIAVIPARGGSKRIPRKNIKNFKGVPIISYAINAAKKSGLFDHIIVSTDDEEIKNVSIDLGAIAPFTRPEHLANDFATTVPVIKHAIEWSANNLGGVTDVCCIYPTVPFIKPKDIISAYEILINSKQVDYVFSATDYSFPIQRAFKVANNGFVEMYFPENYSARSQDLPRSYQDAAQFYWAHSGTFLREEEFFSCNSKAHLLPRYLVQDIDTLSDWVRAEYLYDVLLKAGEIQGA